MLLHELAYILLMFFAFEFQERYYLINEFQAAVYTSLFSLDDKGLRLRMVLTREQSKTWLVLDATYSSG